MLWSEQWRDLGLQEPVQAGAELGRSIPLRSARRESSMSSSEMRSASASASRSHGSGKRNFAGFSAHPRSAESRHRGRVKGSNAAMRRARLRRTSPEGRIDYLLWVGCRRASLISVRGQLARMALDARGNPIAVEFNVVYPLGATGSFLDELAKLRLNPACEEHTTESASMPDANPDLQRLLPDGEEGRCEEDGCKEGRPQEGRQTCASKAQEGGSRCSSGRKRPRILRCWPRRLIRLGAVVRSLIGRSRVQRDKNNPHRACVLRRKDWLSVRRRALWRRQTRRA